MKDLEQEIVAKDEISNIVIETKILIKEDSYDNDSIKDLQKDYPSKIIKLDQVLLKNLGKNEPKILKSEIPDKKWNYLAKKLAHP